MSEAGATAPGHQPAPPGVAPTRVLRVIARMNMGGPAKHVSLLSGLLDRERYETRLLAGEVGPGEASMAYLAAEYGAEAEPVPGLGPEIRPAADARALASLIATVRRFRPDIVHTHTAKAGFLARQAALAVRPRPLIVHTYHGHVLEGYFGRAKTGLYRNLERSLARVSDCLIGVSEQVVDDLVRIGVAPRERFRVVPLGLDLEPLADPPAGAREQFRGELGVGDDQILLVFVGRLVPIKRVDRLLAAFARARSRDERLVLALVGDGEQRAALEAQAVELGVTDAVRFAGYRTDMPVVAAGADVAVLSSDNEGTPVALIEAAAGGRPAVSTDAGGVRAVVTESSGIVVPRVEAALAEAIGRLAADADLRERMGRAAREHVLANFGAERLVADVDALYGELLARRSA